MATIIILYYIAPWWLFIDTEMDDLEWSFCVKIWFELGIQWVGVPAFGENCSEICRATHRVSAATKMYPIDCTSDISVMGLFIVVTEEEASNQ